jgi:hypothetical protein
LQARAGARVGAGNDQHGFHELGHFPFTTVALHNQPGKRLGCQVRIRKIKSSWLKGGFRRIIKGLFLISPTPL